MITIIIYLIILACLLFIIDRYFSGTMYTGDKPNLHGKFAVVTGGNSGIGREIVLDLATTGCRVVFGARDTIKSERVAKEINNTLGRQLVSWLPLDLGDMESIDKFVDGIKSMSEKVDYLVNGAGIMGIERRLNRMGFEGHYAVNYLGHFYLTHLLWKTLIKSDFFRIVNSSSITHERISGFLGRTTIDLDDINFEKGRYSPTLSYARSKLYNNLFTHGLAEMILREGAKGVVVSVHPGVVRTEITRHLISGWLSMLFKIVQPVFRLLTKSVLEGSQTTFTVLYGPEIGLMNGGYYAECKLKKESNLVVKDNWERLWKISERDLGLKFGETLN